MKSDRIELRVTPEARQVIREAAALAGTSVNAFVEDAARRRAESFLMELHVTVLPTEYFDQLRAELDAPPVVVPALARAAERATGTFKRI